MLVRIRAIGNRMWEDIRNLMPEMSKSESLPIFLISKESARKALKPFSIFPNPASTKGEKADVPNLMSWNVQN